MAQEGPAPVEATVHVEASPTPAGPLPTVGEIHARAEAESGAKEADAALRAQTASQTTPADALKDIDGQYSSKRLASFLALAAFLGLALSDAWAHKGVPTEFIMTDLMYIVLGGLGLGALERFGGRK